MCIRDSYYADTGSLAGDNLFNGGNFGRGKADAHYHLYAGGCFQYCNPGDLQPERSDAVPDNGTAADAAAGQDGIGKLYAAGTG